MIKAFSDEAWEDYTYWETQDKKTLKRILKIISDIDRNGYEGIGKFVASWINAICSSGTPFAISFFFILNP